MIALSSAKGSPPPPQVRPDTRGTTVRLLLLGWRYRRRVLMLLALQVVLLASGILAIQLGGYAIDWIRFRRELSFGGVEPAGVSALPPLLYSWHPPLHWPAVAQVLSIAGAVAGIAAARAALNHWYAVANARFINHEMVVDLRIATFDKLQTLPLEFFNRHDVSGLVTRMTSDIQLTRSFVDGVIIQLIVLAISMAFYITAMMRLHVGLTLAVMATTPLLVWYTQRFSKAIRPQYDRNRELFDAMMQRVTENAEGQQAVKAFGVQGQQIEKFAAATAELERQQRGTFWAVSIFTPVVQLLTQLNLIVLLLYGGYLVTAGELPLGSGLVVFAGLMQQFSNQINVLSGITNTIEQSLAGARRIFEVLDAPSRLVDGELEPAAPPQTLPMLRRVSPRRSGGPRRAREGFELRGVSFGYAADRPVLREVDLHLPQGERVGVLGPIGGGKSTLLQLLPRFYDPDQGQVLLDGIDLRHYRLASLRRHVGYIFQEPFLFSDTVANNIAYGDPSAPRDRIRGAAAAAAIDDFIEGLPEGYDTVLGQFGLTLSGGQRQRLALARALLYDPPVLILDDPTSAVDPETEYEIHKTLRSVIAGRTTILVTNRLGTLAGLDRVVMIEDGRVTADTTPRELAARPVGFYREIVGQHAEAS